MSVVLLTRHAQASFGAHDYDALSVLGRRQADVVTARLSASRGRVLKIYHGALRRHRDTANAIRKGFVDNIELTEDFRWNEFDHESMLASLSAGECERIQEGLAPDADAASIYHSCLDAVLERWVDGALLGGESFAAFRIRTDAALDDLLRGLESRETAVVVTSAGVIASTVMRFLGSAPSTWIPLSQATVNTGLTKIVYGRSGPRLVSFNDHAHVEHDRTLLTYR